MMGPVRKCQRKLMYTDIDVSERIGPDHRLRLIKEIVDFSFVRDIVAPCYGYNGNESEDPIVVLKLQLLLYLDHVASERQVMRDLPVRLDWQWFCEFDITDKFPDCTLLSKARRLWGLETFNTVFGHIVKQCFDAGLIDPATVFADSTQLKANASLDSRVARALWEQLEEAEQKAESAEQVKQKQQESSDSDGPDSPASVEPTAASEADGVEPAPAVRTPPPVEDTQAEQLPPPPQGPANTYRVSTTDPDAATMKRRGQSTMLGYRDHCLVEGRSGVILATVAAPGDYDDAAMLPMLIEKQKEYLGRKPDRAVGDGQYGTEANLQWCRQEGIEPYLKRRSGRKKVTNWLDELPPECQRWRAQRLMRRRNIVAEGRFADAHVRHGHRQCRWRRRWRVQIQCYLVAMAQNIAKLIRHARRTRPAKAAAAAVAGVAAVFVAFGLLLRALPALRCLCGAILAQRTAAVPSHGTV